MVTILDKPLFKKGDLVKVHAIPCEVWAIIPNGYDSYMNNFDDKIFKVIESHKNLRCTHSVPFDMLLDLDKIAEILVKPIVYDQYVYTLQELDPGDKIYHWPVQSWAWNSITISAVNTPRGISASIF